jgi:hypothetical protein
MQDSFLHNLVWFITLHIHKVWNLEVDEYCGKMLVSHGFCIVKSQLIILGSHLQSEANFRKMLNRSTTVA